MIADADSPEQLAREVDAILSNGALVSYLMSRRPSRKYDSITRNRLARAWTSLDPDSRHLLRRLYDLDGQGRLTQSQFGRQLTPRRSPDWVSERRNIALRQIAEAIWPTHGFLGLDPTVLKYILWAGISHPGQLYQQANDFIDRGGIGPDRLAIIDAWLRQHNLPPLSEHVTGTRRRRRLGLTSKT